jgi:hypothetical protein
MSATVLELLGSGVGYEFYRDKEVGFSFSDEIQFCLVERSFLSTKQFLATHPEETYDDYIMNRINLFKFFDKRVSERTFDLINLDFCSYFTEASYRSAYSHSCVDVLKKMFEKKCLKPNGLFFTTFQVEGFQIDLNKTLHHIETDQDVINSRIIAIAASYGLRIELLHQFSYKSGVGRGSEMMNSGFILH